VSELPIDPGLLQRLRDAGRAIAWEEGAAAVGPRRGSPKVRVARLREERARIETHVARGGRTNLEVTAGPVGALVVLLEADQRGPPSFLGSRNADRSAGFPDGSIVASWGGTPPTADARPSVRDLVELARYALL
jgi:hypothetical protein